MRKIKLILVGIVSVILLTGCDSAQTQSNDAKVYFGSNVTLDEGETVESGVVIFGGNFEMKKGSTVEGEVVVFGGNIEIDGDVESDVLVMGGNVNIDGTVDGDITAVGGNIKIKDDAEVSGDIDTLGGNIDVDESANVGGEITRNNGESAENSEVAVVEERSVETVVEDRSRSFFGWFAEFIGDGVQNIFMALILGGFGVLLVLFFPSNINQIQDTLYQAAPASLGVGLATMVTSGVVLSVLALLSLLILPICGFAVVAFGLAAGLMAGWTAIGRFLGRRIFARFGNAVPSDVSATFLGVAALTVVSVMPFIDHLPILGYMFWFAGILGGLTMGSIGLGAVILSRFGTRAYLPGGRLIAAGEVNLIEEVDYGDDKN